MTTLQIRMNETEIKRQLTNPKINQLYDPVTGLRLKINKRRTGGSWYYVLRENGKPRWKRLGPYPAMTVKSVSKVLPDLLAKLKTIPDNVNSSGHIHQSVGEVLDWYLEKVLTDTALSESRKLTAKSAIIKHLSPCLGDLKISDISKNQIHERLVWPRQKDYKLSTVKMMFGILKHAFKRALQLEAIHQNPLESFKFSDFITTVIKPKPAALRPQDIKSVISSIEQASEEGRMLALMMLCHGTRIGETRLVKWKNISFKEKVWYLPALDTKTKCEHKLPLTETMVKILKYHHSRQVANGYRGAFLFPHSRTAGQPISPLSANNLFRDMSGGKWTSHDLRKLARTCWADLGIDYMISERLLNHSMTRLDETYIHTYADNKKREALTSYHDFLCQQGLEVF